MKTKHLLSLILCSLMVLTIIVPMVTIAKRPPKPHPNAKWSDKLQGWMYPTPENDPDYQMSIAIRNGTEIEEKPLKPSSLHEYQTSSVPSQTALVRDVRYARYYIDRLYKAHIMYYPSYRDVICEYPASPINVYDWTEKNAGKDQCWNFPGWDGTNDIITEVDVSSTRELLNYDFIELSTGISRSPFFWVDRYYYTDVTKIIVSIRDYDGDHTVDVLWENEGLWWNVNKYGLEDNVGNQLDYPQTWTIETYGSIKAFRYTSRHGSQVGSNLYKVWGYSSKYTNLDNLLNDYEFTVDIYDPLWKMSNAYSDNFLFSYDAYHDCDVYYDLPRSTTSYYGDFIYPYKSKVMINRDLYIAESIYDPLLKCLWVVHMLNKYGEPDTVYFYAPDFEISPRQMMRHVEQDYWDGHGIVYGYEQYVTVRLAVFLEAETILGYKFDDTTSKNMANEAIEVLHQLHVSYYTGEFESEDYGVTVRRPHRGGFLVAYTIGSSYAYAIPKRSTLMEWVFDLYKAIFGWEDMPPETKGLIPTNIETTIVSQQAIRVFLHYYYNYDYPNGSYIP